MRFWSVLVRTTTATVVAIGLLYFMASVMCGGFDFSIWPETERQGFGLTSMALSSVIPIFLMRK